MTSPLGGWGHLRRSRYENYVPRPIEHKGGYQPTGGTRPTKPPPKPSDSAQASPHWRPKSIWKWTHEL